MTLEECTLALGDVALAMRAQLDAPTFRAYHRVLRDVPLPLLQAAADKALDDGDLTFFPTAPEWKGRCEVERRRLLAAHPYDGCAECDMQRGWCAVLVDGVPRVQRCPCWGRHREKLARLGLEGAPIAALSSGLVDEAEGESDQPQFRSLPDQLRGELAVLASKRRIR